METIYDIRSDPTMLTNDVNAVYECFSQLPSFKRCQRELHLRAFDDNSQSYFNVNNALFKR